MSTVMIGDSETGRPMDTSNGVPVDPKQLANERNPGTASQYGVSVEEWEYTIIDHGDTSPVEVSSGNASLVGKVICTEAFAGTPDIALYDGATEVINLPNNMAVGDVIDLSGIKFNTDLDVVIDTAGSAGKVVILWRDQ